MLYPRDPRVITFIARVSTFVGGMSLYTAVLLLIAYMETGKLEAPTYPLLYINGKIGVALFVIYAGQVMGAPKQQDDKTRTAPRLEAHVHALLRLQRGMTDERERFAILHTLIDLWDAGIGWTDTTKALLTKETIRDIAKLADIERPSSSNDWRSWIAYQRYSADESSQAA